MVLKMIDESPYKCINKIPYAGCNGQDSLICGCLLEYITRGENGEMIFQCKGCGKIYKGMI